MRRIILFFVVLVAISYVLRASSSVADPAHEVEVVAKQFAFEPAVIRVKAGEPVRIVIRSSDRVHGFAIRDLKIDVQIPRNGSIAVEFTAPREGIYEIACSEFCGGGHGQMKAALVSVAATPTAGSSLSKGSTSCECSFVRPVWPGRCSSSLHAAAVTAVHRLLAPATRRLPPAQ